MSTGRWKVQSAKRRMHQRYTWLKMKMLVTQSCLILCDPMDYSLPGSSIYGILQARILEWVAISFSRGVFPTQELNPGHLHCRWILYQLSYEGSPHVVIKNKCLWYTNTLTSSFEIVFDTKMSFPLHILSDNWELERRPLNGRDQRSAWAKNQTQNPHSLAQFKVHSSLHYF